MHTVQPMEALLEKAANKTEEGITISDMTVADCPLIYANEGFEKLTGYTRQETLGVNCRFLQGAETEPTSVDEIRQAIKKETTCTVELLNYRKDGSPFWNRLSITPLHDRLGALTHYVGVQSDITELKETKEHLEIVNRRLELFRRNITKELIQARRAQRFILPKCLPHTEHVRFVAKFEPIVEIGGDFFDVVELDENIYGILIADVTGHGIPAALLTFVSSNAFKNSAFGTFSSADVMKSTNAMLYEKMPDNTFVSMFYAIYNANTEQLSYTQAGHPPGLIIRPSTDEIIPLTTNGLLIGIFSQNDVHFEEKQISLMSGDKVLLYTDAIIETADVNNNYFGVERLISFVKDRQELEMEHLMEELYEFGLKYSGKETYEDDFTMLGFEA